LESNKVKIEEAEADAEVVDGDLTACTADLNVLREKVQEARDASTDVQEALAEAKAELDEKSGHINAFRALEVSSTTGFLAAEAELTMLLDGYQAED
jgi:structural maintenance of chromosome 4